PGPPPKPPAPPGGGGGGGGGGGLGGGGGGGGGGGPAAPPPDRIPLSPAQQRMWLINRFDPASPVYNIPVAVRLSGYLDVDALRAAVDDVVQRHETLRTLFPSAPEAGPQQVVLDTGQLDTGPLDLTPRVVTPDTLYDEMVAVAGRGFDVTVETPARGALLRLADDEHVLVVVVHHIAADGASTTPLARDILVAYQARLSGAEPAWAPLAVQYADFAVWQRTLLGDPSDPASIAAHQLAYWTEVLADKPAVLDLPADRPRPAVASQRGARTDFRIDADTVRALDGLARSRGATRFMVLHASLAVLLGRLGSTDDVSVGTPIAGRGEAALDDLVGMFVGTLVLRTRIDPGAGFGELLDRVRDTDLTAFGHADVPFEEIVDTVDPVRSQAHAPLFQVSLSLQNQGTGVLELPGLTVEPLDPGIDVAKVDLEFTLRDDEDDALAASLTYATDLFDADTAATLTERWTRLLRAVATDPTLPVGDLPVLDDAETTRALAHAVPSPLPARTLPDIFAAGVAADPDGIAATDGTRQLTYTELDRASTQLAHKLLEHGVRPETMVALSFPRSIDAIVALWSVVKTGAAFVPIDPALPAARIEYLLSDSGASVGIGTGPSAVPWLSVDADDHPDTPLVPTITALSAAYMIYTSGSTGTPKGVVVTHRGLAAFTAEHRPELGLDTTSRMLRFSSSSFDASVFEQIAAFSAGATMVVAPPEVVGGAELTDLLRRERITHILTAPAALGTLTAADFPDLDVVVVGGDVCPPELVERFGPTCRFVNSYGPTETTIIITATAPLAPGDDITIGTPLDGSGAVVLDNRLTPVADGVVGELYLSGAGLARGYHRRPSQTASRFVANPFTGDLMYRTGDLVRRTATGELDFIGRSDAQVQVRGLRIELGEIEAALTRHDDVAQAVVVVHSDPHTGDRIIGYAVPAAEATVDPQQVRDRLADELPAYMVPAQILVLEALPITAHGKLDRKALPVPGFEARAFRAPENPIEQTVAAVYADLLGAAQVGLDDDFFELGGNSLSATQLVARLGAALDTTVPVRAVFESPTVSALAVVVARTAGEGSRPALVKYERPEHIPLSLAQKRMWFFNRFDPGSAAFNIPIVLRLTGTLDASALRAAMLDVLERHESLRTVYTDTDIGPAQMIVPADQAVTEFATIDITAEDIEARLIEFVSRGFDLSIDLPVRAGLFRISDDDHVLAVVAHHIASDGGSQAPLSRDLVTAYLARSHGDAPGWAPLPVQYADYTLWQKDLLGSEDDPTSLVARQLAYWTSALVDLPDLVEMPTDHPRPAVQSSRGATFEFTLDAELTDRIERFTRERGVTLFMLAHTAVAVLLARWSDSTDIPIGTQVAGRGEPALDDLVGMFGNTLVLRLQIDPAATFDEVLAQARDVDLAAFTHPDVPVERLVELLDPTRSTAYSALFQTLLVVHNFTRSEVSLPGLTIAPVESGAVGAKLDLEIHLGESVDEGGRRTGIDGSITYATDLFTDRTVGRLSAHLVALLDAATRDPHTTVGDIDLRGPDERALARAVNDTATGRDPEKGGDSDTLLTRFVAQAAHTPDAVALVLEGETITYEQFASRVNRLARHLVGEGVGPDSLVGIYAARSVEMMVGIYATLQAGGAYVPLDPEHPAERTEYVLDTARPVLVLTTSAERATLPGAHRVVEVDAALPGLSDAPLTDTDRLGPLRGGNIAYVIFTSGSTGRPKGVAVEHRAVTNQIAWMRERYDLRPGDAAMHKTPITFDASVWELFYPLQVGARLVIAAPGGHRDPAYLADLSRDEGVCILEFVPSMLAAFLADPELELPDSVRYLSVGGEALPADLAAQVAARTGAVLDNTYGPTEATVTSTVLRSDGNYQGSVPIGRPIRNTTAHVLDTRLHSAPVGIPGELYLGGIQLARGYHGRADLTAERFVAAPSGERLYRTGDRVRLLPDGTLDFLGRTDFQVKVRGLRIELGEIESAIVTLDEVARAVVVVHDSDHGPRLVAYVVPISGAAVDRDAVRGAAGRTLPRYMVPDVVMLLDALPLNASGKLDRRALPEPEMAAREFRVPRGDVEQAVAAAVAAVLDVERVGLDDDFFALGGNSLVATRVVSRIGAALGVDVPLRTLFEHPTVEALAAAVADLAVAGARLPLVARERPELVPLSFAQQRMWFLNRFDPASATYNIPAAIRLTGDLDVDALRGAIGDLLARHEILRTVYPEIDGVGVQVIRPVSEITLDLIEEDIEPDRAVEVVTGVIRSGFDVTTDVPVRARLLRVGEREFVLVVVVHHIAADGFSIGPMLRDVMVAYAARSTGQAPVWAPLDVQYADYTLWQRDTLGSEDDPTSVISRQIGYWTHALADVPDVLELPADRARPAVASYRGAAHRMRLDASTHRNLLDLARSRNATLFMVLYSALSAELARLSGTDDISIGTPVAGRGEQALDDLIGMFVNTLVLRNEVDPDEPFSALLSRSREIALGAFAHADVPFEQLVEVLDPPRSQAHNPLFQVMLTLQNMERSHFELDDVRIEAIDADLGEAKVDLQITVFEVFDDDGAPAGIDAEWTYATDLFDNTTVVSFAERFTRLLAAVLADPELRVAALPLLDDDERAAVLALGVGPKSIADECITPDNSEGTAVTSAEESLTRGEFDDRVAGLARELIARGIGPETRVAVYMERSVDLLVAIHAILQAGGAYVPLDPSHPVERIAHIVETSKPVLAMVRASTETLPVPMLDVTSVDASHTTSPISDVDRLTPLRPDHTAYVVFTSGSTGRPKGVAVTHRALNTQLDWMRHTLGLTGDDVVLWKTPVTFDASVWELFLPMRIGARLVVADPDGHADPAYLASVIAAEQVTIAQFVPSVLDPVLDEDPGPSLQHVFSGGEPLRVATAERVCDVLGAQIHNLYGPTETTIQVTHRSGTSGTGQSIPIGTPVAETTLLVLDARLRPVPVGVRGELYVAGAQLARGYENATGQTASRFVADPYSTSGTRMYRTGDVVRWTPAGELEYLGRSDHQIKLRGLRIEIGEIESVLQAMDTVAAAAVAVVSDRLVGYVVPADGTLVDLDSVRDAASDQLPSYMIPDVVVLLEAMPLNTSGKLDRRALPEPVFETREFRAPTRATQETVAQVFADVLGIEQVGLDDDFFSLGGNSLVATRVASRLGAAVDAQIPVRLLFESPTVEALASAVDELAGTGGTIILEPQPRPERIPLSLAQNRMWFLNRFDPGSAVNNIPAAIRLSGHLDVAALQSAVSDLIVRHEVLRTVYPEVDGVGHQVVLPPVGFSELLSVESVSADEVFERAALLVGAGFDVTAAPPLRAVLLRVSDTEHVLVVVVHHIAADGFSMGPLSQDVMLAYAARAAGEIPSWEPLEVQYADYALWQRKILGSESDPESVLSRQLTYWSEVLAGVPDVLDLPADRSRPAAASYRGASHEFALDESLSSGIESLARDRNVTPFMLVHSVLAVLLARMSGTRDIVIGTPVAGRGEQALDDLIGMFVNTLVLRTEIDGAESFEELLSRVKDVDLGAFGHADVPFERLVEALDPVRSTAWNPLFQVMLTFQNFAPTSFELPGLMLSAVEADLRLAKVDLQFTLSEQAGGGFTAAITYATDLFDEVGISLLAQRFTRLLAAVVAAPEIEVGAVDLLASDERARLEMIGKGTVVPVLGQLVPDLLTEQVERSPDAPALVADGRMVSYREFARDVLLLAHHLIGLGVGPEVRVAVAMGRSLDLVVALHAVLAAGGTYIPIDPEQPAERIAHILDAANPTLVLSRSNYDIDTDRNVLCIDTIDLDGRDDSVTDADRLAPLRPGNTAYVIFTSGSTGRPKGVAVSHAAAVNQIAWISDRFGIGAADTVLLKTPFTFDVSVWELFAPLACGARLVVASANGHKDPQYLAETIDEHAVSLVSFVPSMLDVFVEQLNTDACGSLRAVLVAGEALGPVTVSRLRSVLPNAMVHNLYGPTEFTVHATETVIDDERAVVSIGRPVWNSDAYVLDARLQLVPDGVPGELYLSGPQVARGYEGRPDLTADRFVANPFADGFCMYRTGDMVRRNNSGDLEYIGRSDFQVKLRGLRIELGEVETVLRGIDHVGACVVVARADQLVGYVVPAGDVDVSDLRAAMSRVLPGYMVPSQFVVLEALPLNASGKLDRKALPDPVFEAREFRAPTTRVELAVASVFAEVLGTEQVGLDDDFFALGGTSLVATTLVSRLRAELDTQVPLQWLFQASTVEGLARLVAEGTDTSMADALGPVLPLRAQGSGTPLFCVHPIVGLSWCYTGLSQQLDTDVYGLQTPAGLEADFAPATLDDLATRYVEELRRVQPHGPYRLLGWSLGGVIAHAMAVQLQAAGESVEHLVMLDSFVGGSSEPSADEGAEVSMSDLVAGFGFDGNAPQSISGLVATVAELTGNSVDDTEEMVQRLIATAEHNSLLLGRHRPGVFDGDVVYFTASSDGRRGAADWADAVTGEIHDHSVPVTHWHMTSPEALAVVGPAVRRVIEPPPTTDN
ncbi:amino acid adenylation domain-containing protein, partial [Rhodococcus sp. NPDC060086]|uniref:non-ribosomal peptide synthetase n=1 Tax=Rhodococcus sp. NPDC060086 TaxID=3347055 RepID=UPI0036623D77